jgi:hypothetical protein
MTDDEKPRIHEPEGEAKLIVEVSRSVPFSQLTRGWKPQERQALNRNEPDALRKLYDTLLRETLKAPDSITGLRSRSTTKQRSDRRIRRVGKARRARETHPLLPSGQPRRSVLYREPGQVIPANYHPWVPDSGFGSPIP